MRRKKRVFTMNVEMENAAFRDPFDGTEDKTYEGIEINRLLRHVIEKIEDGCTHGNLFDVNGNWVGKWSR